MSKALYNVRYTPGLIVPPIPSSIIAITNVVLYQNRLFFNDLGGNRVCYEINGVMSFRNYSDVDGNDVEVILIDDTPVIMYNSANVTAGPGATPLIELMQTFTPVTPVP